MRTQQHVNASFCHSSPRGTFNSSPSIRKNLHAPRAPKFKCLTTHYMFSRTLCSSSRPLTTLCFPSKIHRHLNLKTHIPTLIFPSTQKKKKKITISVHPNSLFVRMASGEQKFPPQKQQTQPGKEHVMDPAPQFTNPDYKPSNKLPSLY